MNIFSSFLDFSVIRRENFSSLKRNFSPTIWLIALNYGHKQKDEEESQWLMHVRLSTHTYTTSASIYFRKLKNFEKIEQHETTKTIVRSLDNYWLCRSMFIVGIFWKSRHAFHMLIHNQSATIIMYVKKEALQHCLQLLELRWQNVFAVNLLTWLLCMKF
jgi:hypothetical protein